MNKYYMPRYFQVFFKMLPAIALWSKILLLPDSKPEDSFLQCDVYKLIATQSSFLEQKI